MDLDQERLWAAGMASRAMAPLRAAKPLQNGDRSYGPLGRLGSVRTWPIVGEACFSVS